MFAILPEKQDICYTMESKPEAVKAYDRGRPQQSGNGIGKENGSRMENKIRYGTDTAEK